VPRTSPGPDGLVLVRRDVDGREVGAGPEPLGVCLEQGFETVGVATDE
jgi:hypothetical protein